MGEPTDVELSAFLEEGLPVERLAEIEIRLRDDEGLRARLRGVIGREDAGLHSVGVIWRRHRLSCPSRDEISQAILGVLDPPREEYLKFHIEQVGCRYCAANLADLRAAHETSAPSAERRRRYFETSAGHLRGTSGAPKSR